MAIKHQLQQSIYSIIKHNRDGSFATQAARREILFLASKELVEGGYKLKNVQGLKQKHIYYLNQLWQERKLSNGTMKNRNAHLRWLCEKLHKANLMPTNDELKVGKRRYASNADNKAIELKDGNLAKVTNPFIYISLHLQRHFGLRREECIKFKPCVADKGDHIFLESTWCKGGRSRTVPILTEEARYWLEQSKKLVNYSNSALIPDSKTYKQQKKLYENQTKAAGFKHPHGLRHAYAQQRYKELTGWDCPKAGGPISKKLTREQKAKDKVARLTISQELGHCREQILVNYCGR